MAQHGNMQQKNNAGVWRVVFVVALIVLVAALAGLGVMAYSYMQGQMKYNDVAKESGFDADDVERGQLAEASVDWDALLKTNADTVAWLYIPNTSINYPVVRGEDNDFYLTHGFDGDAGWLANYGTVFMDYRNNPDWSDQLYFTYGHHMNDGSMFSDLAGFTDQARFDECRTVYLLSPRGNFKLRSFAMLHIDGDETIVQQNFASADDMTAYIQDKIDKSAVDPGTIPAAPDIKKAFGFSTCDNLSTDGRYVLYAYVDETSAEGLTGTLGLEVSDGQTTGFVNDLMMEKPESEG